MACRTGDPSKVADADDLGARVVGFFSEDQEAGNPTLFRWYAECLRRASSAILVEVGPDLPEKVYQKALLQHLKYAGFSALREVKVPGQFVGRYADLVFSLPGGRAPAIVEVKALRSIAGGNHEAVAQVKCYMERLGIDNGFIINFPRQSRFPAPVESYTETIIRGVTSGLRIGRSKRRTESSRVEPQILSYQKRRRHSDG